MWIAYSLGAMVLLAAMTLMFVPAGRAGTSPAIILFYLFLLACASISACSSFNGRRSPSRGKPCCGSPARR